MTVAPSTTTPTLHVCRLRDLGPLTVPDPEFGDLRLSIFPFTHDGTTPIALPQGFGLWEATIREIMAHVPVQPAATQFFVTIDSRFFTVEGFLRREGVHMDGNFCADPTFVSATWGGAMPTWGGGLTPPPKTPPKTPTKAPAKPLPPPPQGDPKPAPKPRPTGLHALGTQEMPDNSHVEMGFALPYAIVIPIGQYVSGHLGGTLVVSSHFGCRAWPGVYSGEVGPGGDWSEMTEQLGDAMDLTEHRLWFLSSNCPHETLTIPQGARRTFVRITFPHNYDNRGF